MTGSGMGDSADGGFDLGGLLEQAQAMQQRLLEAQAAAAEQEVEGESGGGVVKVRVTGGMEFRSVSIDPKAVDPTDVEMLEDLVLAAIHDAVARARELNDSAMGTLDLGDLGRLAGGMPGLPGMPGPAGS
ncbi:MAG TPA: YbaB/EbfC family nucleoid-associated protein [Acidimicrobiales bacterium]|nr:YbaB/EbfC family nucleoid-associated protein [Acidimicrobiales bacterium]